MSELERTIGILREKYAEALRTEYVKWPLEWAVHKTWVKIHREREEGNNLIHNDGERSTDEIVRCRDCVWGSERTVLVGAGEPVQVKHCRKMGLWRSEDFYCAYGERKPENGTDPDYY